jgi:hypothetical protein
MATAAITWIVLVVCACERALTLQGLHIAFATMDIHMPSGREMLSLTHPHCQGCTSNGNARRNRPHFHNELKAGNNISWVRCINSWIGAVAIVHSVHAHSECPGFGKSGHFRSSQKRVFAISRCSPAVQRR